mmetsp:Transcript_29353/g.61211  ORF Transcript_29353/g.61211 Transcript_29353/m.61211 type:complete len:212 (+) Transcript_29353:214-849(+)
MMPRPRYCYGASVPRRLSQRSAVRRRGNRRASARPKMATTTATKIKTYPLTTSRTSSPPNLLRLKKRPMMIPMIPMMTTILGKRPPPKEARPPTATARRDPPKERRKRRSARVALPPIPNPTRRMPEAEGRPPPTETDSARRPSPPPADRPINPSPPSRRTSSRRAKLRASPPSWRDCCIRTVPRRKKTSSWGTWRRRASTLPTWCRSRGR